MKKPGKSKTYRAFMPTVCGRRDWTRTNDPHHVKMVSDGLHWDALSFLERPFPFLNQQLTIPPTLQAGSLKVTAAGFAVYPLVYPSEARRRNL